MSLTRIQEMQNHLYIAFSLASSRADEGQADRKSHLQDMAALASSYADLVQADAVDTANYLKCRELGIAPFWNR